MSRTRQGNRAGRSCVREEKTAPLTSEFGMTMLRKKFPDLADEILERLGTYTRGPRKGLQRGYITWTKVIEGGWHYGEGRVVYPGTHDWDVRKSPDLRDPSIPGAIVRERDAAETARYRALSPAERWIEAACKARQVAHMQLRFAVGEYREYDLSDFRESMQHARRCVRYAKACKQR